ncbi:hypothetical protein A1O1_02479 [Capronia coronata CBS 617.96]|uniref:Alpha-1,3-mannosyltransferase n=1 Tax=Capronia coronata CBS 617.96 TaxID=1182541 RepID=W9YXT6_9EURO|nr:uncharacterized protein A1O1_02479 [Capronia coronata CBS 617.96]EXJ94086.1 hypothetical protein A1O1_02479 [Capronia coronata CBS 617.96]
MFTPRHAPLKEGRSFPGLPNSGPTRRGLRSRQGAAILVVLLCIPLIYFLSSSSSSPNEIIQSPDSIRPPANNPREVARDAEVVLKPDSNGPPKPPRVQPVDPADVNPAEPNSPAGAGPRFEAPPDEAPKPKPKAPAGSEAGDEEPVPAKDSDSPAQAQSQPDSVDGPVRGKITANAGSFSERPRFERALSRVINLLPGEMEGRDLLRQVEGTGKEKLREMGLRVREYKKFYEAWEDLHLTADEEGGTYVRDDVIQYLRHHVHQSTSDELAEAGLAQTVHSYEAYRYFLVKFGQLLFPWTAPYFPDHMTLHSHFKRGGRGIVLTAGDDQAPFLLTTIPTFRKLGCDLPIEVMYLGDSDLSEDYRADLEALDGVITRDIAQMVNDEGWKLAGWAAKPFAILFSSFREVIFIDADSLFFKNPEVLFDDPGYQKTGALFFRDRLIMPENKKRWLQQILPKPISRQVKQSRFWTGESGHMQESGVVVVDKWRHFMALLLVTRMNGPDRDGNKEEGRVGVYDMVYGDKETFWIGWELVGDLDYSFHQGDAGAMGVLQAPEVKDDDKEKERKEKEKPKPKRKKKVKKPAVVNDNGEVVEGGGQDPQQGDGAEGVEVEVEVEEEEEPEPQEQPEEKAPEPTSYTMCAPQLLHLDTEGKPLWFNGWLLDNKFADKKQKKFGKWEHYLIEPHDIREPGAWQLEESNMCCLTTDPPLKREFTAEEKAVLQMMIDQARQVGVPG